MPAWGVPALTLPVQGDLPASAAGPAPAKEPQPAPARPPQLIGQAPGTGQPDRQRPRLPFLRWRAAQPAERAASPPAEAWLEWPDGRRSAGTVQSTPAGRMFTVGSADAVLAERGCKGAGTALPADAAPAGCDRNVFIPRLPALPAAAGRGGRWLGSHHVWHSLLVDGTAVAEPMALTRDALAAVVRVAGGIRGERLDWNQQAVVQHLLAHALQKVAPQCAEPAEAARVAQALNDDHDLFLLYGLPEPDAPPGRACASFDAKAFRKHLAGLSPGQHGYVRVTLVHGDTSHALALAVRKEGGGQVRMAAINPAGWLQVALGETVPPGRIRIAPGIFRRADVDAAAQAMTGLLSGPPPAIPAPHDTKEWVCSGQPLHAWLAGLGAAPGGNLQADFHGTGRPLLTAPQKTHDCTVERVFAFMATGLAPADYKLAKAAGLSLLAQLADRLEPPGTAAPDSALERARCGLEWRLTSSLSGSVAAASREAAGLRMQ
jgi:hypothetical protein